MNTDFLDNKIALKPQKSNNDNELLYNSSQTKYMQ